jgi:hypothetical protein
MLDAARRFISARGAEISRFWYLSASFCTTFLFATIGCVVYLAHIWLPSALGELAVPITLAFLAGAMGALLSVILRSGALKFDCSAGRKLHYLEGSSRIVAGAISGFAVALATKADIILTFFTRGTNNVNLVVALAAILAGLSERLAPSIISTLETSDRPRSGPAGGTARSMGE